MTVRKYRTVRAIWGFGISKSSLGWTLQFGPWCFTTEPDPESD